VDVLQAPSGKESFDHSLFQGVDWSGEVSEEKLQIARGDLTSCFHYHLANFFCPRHGAY
jgi:hypothetical protein